MDREIAAFDALAKHPRLDAVAGLVGELVRAATTGRAFSGWPESAAGKVEALALTDVEAETDYGDLRAVLRRGPETEAEGTLVRALAAHALASHPPSDDDATLRFASELLWLAAETPFDALRTIDRALGEDLAEATWSAIAARVRRADGPNGSRGEALLGATALAASSSAFARKLAARLKKELRDPWLRGALGREEGGAVVDGEMTPGPRSLVATICLGLTGILFVVSGARLFAKVALAVKRPATVRIGASGIDIETRTEMLGRTLRERRIRIDRAALARAAREVRYPRVAFYAGLFALAIGSYLGVSLLVDGTRAASPSLLALGLVIIAAGVAIDFGLAGLTTSVRGKCRLVLVPRRGPAVAIDGLDRDVADRALEALKVG
ncbi:MAG: hypothetical protein K1X94_35735 [Sandaracinaceae bacterium]|nr:hypothetical protein [Sandaracinaceae bacterium]